MPEIRLEKGPDGMMVRLGDLVVNLSELRHRVASIGRGTKEVGSTVDIETKRRKPGKDQMRHKDGSYLTKDEVAEEEFCRKNHIA